MSVSVFSNTGSAAIAFAASQKTLPIGRERVRRYLREGVLPGERIGNQWFIDQFDLDQMLEARQRGEGLADAIGVAGRDPLGAVIGIGSSGGGEVSLGTVAYLQALETPDRS